MKIFGTVFPFVESNDTSLKLGRYVANYDFLKALLEHGNFDEYHLFCMNAVHFNQTTQKLLSEDLPNDKKNKVKLFLYDHLISMISTNTYHVFHLGGWGYFFPGLTYIRNKHAKTLFPITGLIHSLNGKETNFHAYKMIKAPLFPFDRIICSSKAGRKVLEKTFKIIEQNISQSFKGGLDIIPLGINNTEKKMSREYARNQEGLQDNTIRILTIGRISPITKFDPYPIIIAISDIIKGRPDLDIELIIAGGATSAEKKLTQDMIKEEGIEDHIKVISNFSDREKEALLLSSDIYISLIDNLQETFGISIIEAMNKGLPTIVSDLNGYKELVEENESGFKIPSLWTNDFELNELSSIMDFNTLQLMLAQNMAIDIEIFKKRIISLAEDANLRKRMGQKGRDIVIRKYLWRNIIKQYEDLWNSLNKESQKFNSNKSSDIDIFANNYLDLFSHYPTNTLSGKDKFQISERGIKALDSGQIPVAYNNIQPLINQDQVVNILNQLMNSPLSLSEIQNINSTHILWMMKYGLISKV